MSDFFQSGGDDIDFDRAASAFPAISLDGEGDIPTPSQAPPLAGRNDGSGFSFDDFDSPPTQTHTDVKVTGDDEIEKFENEFPNIDIGQVSFVKYRGRVQGNRACCEDSLRGPSAHYYAHPVMLLLSMLLNQLRLRLQY
jgi:hypothetical protein